MQLILIAKDFNAHDAMNLKNELDARLKGSYERINFCGDLPAPSKDMSFTLQSSGNELALSIDGSQDDVRNAIGRWCTCCSTVESDEITIYHKGHARLFADDPETGRSRSTERWYQAKRGSVSAHLEGKRPITLGSSTPISFSVGSFSL